LQARTFSDKLQHSFSRTRTKRNSAPNRRPLLSVDLIGPVSPAPICAGWCSLRKKKMQCDEDLKIGPPVEFARASLIDGALMRTIEQDSAGETVEVYNTKPIPVPQMEAAMTFILYRLLGTELGEGSNRTALREQEICVDYLVPVARQADCDILTPGFRLAVSPIWREFSDADLDRLRDVAFQAAKELIFGCEATSEEASFLSLRNEEMAARIHSKLKAQRIQQPFIFDATAGRVVVFSGAFSGEETVNMQEGDVPFDGSMYRVEYRGITLNFDFECSDGRRINVEFSPQFRAAVLKQASPELWDSKITIRCQVHSSKKDTGKVVKTFMLESIGDFKPIQYSDWEELDLCPELVEDQSPWGGANR
jgi:hypothetical protein